MEHVEVNDKVRSHRIYRDLLCGGFGYGARRWTATLERMCERLSLYSVSGLPTTDFPGGTYIIYQNPILYNINLVKLIFVMCEPNDFKPLSKKQNKLFLFIIF